MGRIFGLLGLVIVLGIGYYIYIRQAQTASSTTGTAAPKAAVDVTGVRMDLLSFANAERQEFALEAKYLSIDDLRAKGVNLPADHRGPYSYSSAVTDSGFRISAIADEQLPGAPKSLSITEKMEIETQ
ncbi:MAG TPA: hypothetical protein VF133_06510 [Terriglobales bacterium]